MVELDPPPGGKRQLRERDSEFVMERDRNVVFAGAIPENYDRYLGPVIFEPYAEDLVSRLKGKKFDRVLEIACGTGIVTRRLRDTLPATTEIVATDLNPDMFEFAKAKFRSGENIRWQQADARADALRLSA